MASLVYYVSGHGFGHAVRSAEIIRALQRQRRGLPIHVRTTAPDWPFPAVQTCQPVQLDVGVVQPDTLRIDIETTLARAAALAGETNALVGREVDFLAGIGARLVVGDVPPPAFLAAAAAGLPGVGVANFSWDWIYHPSVASYPEYTWLVESPREAYGKADLLLRLPFHGEMSAFRVIEDVPLVSRPPSAARSTLRRRLGLAPAGPRSCWALADWVCRGCRPTVLRN